MAERQYRQEGRGSREVPRGVDRMFRPMVKAMRAMEWTFEERGKSIVCYAPFFIPGGINSVNFAKTPSDVNALRPPRTRYRQWCRENGIKPNL